MLSLTYTLGYHQSQGMITDKAFITTITFYTYTAHLILKINLC